MCTLFTLIILLAVIEAYGETAEKTLERYAVKFRAEARIHAPLYSPDELISSEVLRGIVIQFGPPMSRSILEGSESSELGNCRRGGDLDKPVLNIIREKFESHKDEWVREMIIYHELGHCVLNREHDGRHIIRNGQSIPKSIMYPHIFDRGDYILNHSYYLDELFSGLITAPILNPEKAIGNDIPDDSE